MCPPPGLPAALGASLAQTRWPWTARDKEEPQRCLVGWQGGALGSRILWGGEGEVQGYGGGGVAMSIRQLQRSGSLGAS